MPLGEAGFVLGVGAEGGVGWVEVAEGSWRFSWFGGSFRGVVVASPPHSLGGLKGFWRRCHWSMGNKRLECLVCNLSALSLSGLLIM